MKDKEDRSAQFRTAISLILDGKKYLFEGIIRGQITTEKREKQASATILSLCPKVTTKPSQNWAAK